MDKAQANAIAHAILESGHHDQEELRQKRMAEAARLARRRRVVWFTLAGCGLGGVAAYFTGLRVTQGIFFGGIAGTLAGGLLTRRSA
jgi:type VI protein secretion system component VasF